MMAKQKIFCNIVVIVIIVLSVCGCIGDEESRFDIDDTVIEAEYTGKNKYNDSVVKITRVENPPKGEDVYAMVKDPNGTYLEWHVWAENPSIKYPISTITHIGISHSCKNEDICWNDIYEDEELRPDEEFFISEEVIPPDSTGYKFILEYKNGVVLLEVDID